MFPAFIITFRESLEAGVIVGLMFAILRSYQALKQSHYIWIGVIAGIITSLLLAWAFNVFLGGFEGKNEKIYEGFLMLGACALITHLVFWMAKHGRLIKQKLETKMKDVLESKTLWMLSVIVFFSVIREGIETVIFFQAIDVQADGQASWIGAGLGVIIAVILSYLIYKGSAKIKLQKFFQISSLLLIFIAAGLLAHGIVEFQGAGWLPTYIKPLFDLSPILSEKEGLGALLKALFRYDANPSLIAVMAYIGYLSTALYLHRKQ